VQRRCGMRNPYENAAARQFLFFFANEHGLHSAVVWVFVFMSGFLFGLVWRVGAKPKEPDTRCICICIGH